MNKIFTFVCAFLAMAGVVSAQGIDNTFQFVDKDGNVLADGSTITATEVEDDGFGGLQILSGLSVKNTTDADAYVGMSYSIASLPNGSLSCCFPSNCVNQDAPGNYVTTKDMMSAGETRNMRTEWIIEEAGKYGTCIATFNLECYDYNAITRQYKLAGHGPSVTVHFVYANPSAIVRTTARAVSVYYDLHGFPLETEPAKGLFIRRTQCADGSFVTQKVMKP